MKKSFANALLILLTAILLTALLGHSTFLSAQEGVDKSKYLGLKYPGVMVGQKVMDVEEMGGGLIEGLLPNSPTMVGVSQKSQGSTRMLWLENAVGKDPKGGPVWQVKDILVFPVFGKNQTLHVAGDPTCTRNGKEDLSLVVLTDSNPPSPALKILKAWTANVKTEKFEDTTLSGVKCEALAP